MEGFYIIRSDRILQSLQEATLSTFKSNIERGFPNTRKRQFATDPIRISQLKITPFVGTKSLFIKGVANSTGRIYDPMIFFTQVRYQPADTQDNITFVASDGKQYHIIPLSFVDDNAQVRCNCLDFHYRFAWHNAKAGDLYGRPPPKYIRKTTTRPPVNPLGVPGMCKHLLKLVEALEEAGMITPTPRVPTPDIEPKTYPEEPQPEVPPQEEVPEVPPEETGEEENI